MRYVLTFVDYASPHRFQTLDNEPQHSCFLATSDAKFGKQLTGWVRYAFAGSGDLSHCPLMIQRDPSALSPELLGLSARRSTGTRVCSVNSDVQGLIITVGTSCGSLTLVKHACMETASLCKTRLIQVDKSLEGYQ